MLRTLEELNDLFCCTIKEFNGKAKIIEDRRLSETYFDRWKSKAEIEEMETKQMNIKILRLNLKNDFDLFCDKEIESIKIFCEESKVKILMS